MEKKIVWEAWRDDENYVEAVNDLQQEIMSQEFDDDDEDDEDDSPQDAAKIDIMVSPHYVKTPLGTFSVLDHNLPSKNFQCWIGHFNFPITRSVFRILNEDIAGIDALRVLSKYRVFIGIAKLFSLQDITKQTDELLLGKPRETSFSHTEDDSGV
jgi:hypothetical protein